MCQVGGQERSRGSQTQRRKGQPGRRLGAERAGRPGVPHPHAHRAITGLTVWDEVPLFWRNCSWQAEFQEVTNGEVLSSREWGQGRQRRERSGERRTLTGVGGGSRKVRASQMQPFTAHRVLIEENGNGETTDK